MYTHTSYIMWFWPNQVVCLLVVSVLYAVESCPAFQIWQFAVSVT
jgi:hypothetical protein